MNEKKYNWIAYLLLLSYLLIACYKISSPGLQYDEMLFVNAAQHTKYDSSFIIKSLKGFPILLMPYIGALKSYIYYPIINSLGVNIWTLRLPVILITILSLWVITKLTNKIFNKEFALIVLLILALNPTLVYMTRLDVGPNVLELFLKSVACFLFYRFFFEKASFNNLILGFIILGMGLFNKLNFIWFINASYATIFIFNFECIRKGIVEKDVKNLKPYLAIAASYVVYATYLIIIIKGYNLVHTSDSSSILDSFINKVSVMNGVVNGTTFLGYIYSKVNSKIYTYILYLYGFIIVCGSILNLINKKSAFIEKYKRIYFSICLLIFFDSIQIVLTKEATAPWHAFTIYPFFTIVLVYSLYSIHHVLGAYRANVANLMLAGLVSIIVIYQCSVIVSYFNKLGTSTKNVAWSDEIYKLIDYTKNTNAKFVSLDWGFHNVLIAFDNKKDKYHELSFAINGNITEDEKKWITKSYIQDSSVVFISHSDKGQIFTKALENFKNLAKESNKDLIVIKTFKDSYGEIYLLYSVRDRVITKKPSE